MQIPHMKLGTGTQHAPKQTHTIGSLLGLSILVDIFTLCSISQAFVDIFFWCKTAQLRNQASNGQPNSISTTFFHYLNFYGSKLQFKFQVFLLWPLPGIKTSTQVPSLFEIPPLAAPWDPNFNSSSKFNLDFSFGSNLGSKIQFKFQV